MIPPNGEDSPELLGPLPCGECGRVLIEETSDTLFAVLTSRLECRRRSRCSIGETIREGLPPGTIHRRKLRVESLRNKGRIGECNFDYEAERLRISSAIQKGKNCINIEDCQFSLDDIRLDAIVRKFVKDLALVGDDNDNDVGEEVRFEKQLADVRLAFQQPCKHVPRCSGF